MIRNSTLFVLLCLSLLSQNIAAQTCTMSYTDPNPTPGFGMPLNVEAANDFTSSNLSVFNSFPKNKSTTITSPEYIYTAAQPTIYFKYSFNIAVAGTTTTSPIVRILYGTNSFITCTTSTPFTINNGTNDLYFSLTPLTLFPANTAFKIELTMDISNSDKAVSALTLSTNALLRSAQSVLPVRFTLFNAKKVNTGVAVIWNVDLEENVTVYEVQRSVNGKNFTTIGSVDAIGQRTYSHTDTKALPNAYYRIKSVDLDGKYMYSTIINIKGENSSVMLKAFPMPVQGDLTLQHETANENSRLTLVSVDGRIVRINKLTPGEQQTTIDLSGYKAGLYFARYDNGNGEITNFKIIKQ
jgi:hypothetical protein